MSITDSNIRGVDLNLLPMLSVLLETRSVSRTAEKMNLSQPAVSRALKRMREQLGDSLLVRGKGGMVPTEKGAALMPLLASVWEHLNPIVAPAPFNPQTATRIFVVSGSDYLEAVLLPRLLKRLEAEAPNIGIRTTALNLQTWQSLEEGTVDMTLSLDRNLPSHLKRRLLFKDEYVGIASKDNDAIKGTLDLDTYCALPHLQVKIYTRHRQPASPIDVSLGAVNRRRLIAVTIANLFNAARIVAGTRLIATMPSRVAHLDAETYPIAVYSLPITLPTANVALGWHPRLHEDPAHRFLRKLIVDVATKRLPTNN